MVSLALSNLFVAEPYIFDIYSMSEDEDSDWLAEYRFDQKDVEIFDIEDDYFMSSKFPSKFGTGCALRKKSSLKLTKKNTHRYVSAYQMKKEERRREVIAQNHRAAKTFSYASPGWTRRGPPVSSSTTTKRQTRTTQYRPASHKSSYERDLERAIAASLNTPSGRSNSTHASGLTMAQIQELSNRELTAEDYEMLLLLDTTVQKKTVEKDTIKSLPVRTLTQSSAIAEENACSVCMCDFEAGEQMKTLPCKHNFHIACIDTWLESHSQSCPLCKTLVT